MLVFKLLYTLHAHANVKTLYNNELINAFEFETMCVRLMDRIREETHIVQGKLPQASSGIDRGSARHRHESDALHC